jgi:type IV secretion system protein VirB9
MRQSRAGWAQRLATALALVLTIVPPSSWCEIRPARGPGDARIRYARYSADEVYRIQGFVGFQIDLEFERGESFIGLAAGDIEGLSFVAQDNHLFLKPRVPAVGTNLTILTTRRQYQLYYTAVAHRPEDVESDMVYAVRFQYASAAARNADRLIEDRLEYAPAARAHNLDYWYCGAPTLRPSSAWDDGVQTRLRFNTRTELPVIFVRNDDGSESLLNFSLESGEVVVHRVARRFVLRRGGLTGCVVNKAFTGVGERLESGTVAPNVQRENRGTMP